MALSVVSYNVLADAYLRPEWYRQSPAAALDPARRRPALLDHVAAADADVACLQEVEAGLFDALAARLGPLGYEGRFLKKGGGKPDGCATFFRPSRCRLLAEHRWRYRDGPPGCSDSGHVALVLQLQWACRPLFVANTHVKWDPPDTPAPERWGYRQAADFLRRKAELPAAAWVLCGDFNATADGDVLRLLFDAGFADAYAEKTHSFTCVSNGRAKRIDFLLHTRELIANPEGLPPLADDTPLPSAEQPSDHLIIRADLDWRT